jgi:hypothetical protein
VGYLVGRGECGARLWNYMYISIMICSWGMCFFWLWPYGSYVLELYLVHSGSDICQLLRVYLHVYVCMNCAVNELICNQRENLTGGDGCVTMVGA